MLKLGVFILSVSEVREGSLLCTGAFLEEFCRLRISEIRAGLCRAQERTLTPVTRDLSSCSFLDERNQVSYSDMNTMRIWN